MCSQMFRHPERETGVVFLHIAIQQHIRPVALVDAHHVDHGGIGGLEVVLLILRPEPMQQHLLHLHLVLLQAHVLQRIQRL